MSYRKIKKRVRSWKFQMRRKFSLENILSEGESHKQIGALIQNQTPAAIGKIGSTELMGLKHLKHYGKDPAHLQSQQGKRVIYKLNKNSGVFPADEATYAQFCDTYTESLSQITLLAPWFPKGESRIIKTYAKQAQLISSDPLSVYPVESERSHYWTQSLNGKKILVVHPFEKTITQQFPNRSKIWPGENPFLAECTLKTLKVPLYDAIVPSPYSSWTEGLSAMKAQMTEVEFDVALIGAGAWSLPLAVHAKELGKIGMHLGGATQLLFGIKGKRWDENGEPDFYNDAWVRPSPEETPETAHIVESGCYW